MSKTFLDVQKLFEIPGISGNDWFDIISFFFHFNKLGINAPRYPGSKRFLAEK